MVLINNAFAAELKEILAPEQIVFDAPMREHTTFKIGGPADCLLFPSSFADVTAIYKLLAKYDVAVTILGNGSNVLVLDKGIRGAVLKFGPAFADIKREGNCLRVGAGAMLKDVSRYAADCSLSGLEFAIGIPGSIGGAVFMNAGAYDGEMKMVVTEVKTVTAKGEVRTYTQDELDFGYRHSVFQDNGEVICEVVLNLQPGEPAEISEKMEGFTKRRESKQPLEMPSAGSTFKRPAGYYAGTLIDQTGLKGFNVGGAQISLKHAGFVVNTGNATAADVLNLIKAVQDKVYAKHGVKLYPEVRIIGE